jgi:hypothetical protein
VAQDTVTLQSTTQIRSGSVHEVTLEYSPSLGMLYAKLDGSSTPVLAAPLNLAAALAADIDTPLWAGFTASSGAAPLSITIGNWTLGAATVDPARTQLVQGGRVGGRVGVLSTVTLDARDSCGMPFARGGVLWNIELTAPSGALVPTTSHDSGDGTYRVSFVPLEAGEHSLRGTHNGVTTSSLVFAVLPDWAQ